MPEGSENPTTEDSLRAVGLRGQPLPPVFRPVTAGRKARHAKEMAPATGLEPVTYWLTANRSTIELRWNRKSRGKIVRTAGKSSPQTGKTGKNRRSPHAGARGSCPAARFSMQWKNFRRFFHTMEKLWPIFPQCGKKFSTVWKNPAGAMSRASPHGGGAGPGQSRAATSRKARRISSSPGIWRWRMRTLPLQMVVSTHSGVAA